MGSHAETLLSCIGSTPSGRFLNTADQTAGEREMTVDAEVEIFGCPNPLEGQSWHKIAENPLNIREGVARRIACALMG